MKCRTCHTELDPGAKFCPECGQKVETSLSAADPSADHGPGGPDPKTGPLSSSVSESGSQEERDSLFQALLEDLQTADSGRTDTSYEEDIYEEMDPGNIPPVPEARKIRVEPEQQSGTIRRFWKQNGWLSRLELILLGIALVLFVLAVFFHKWAAIFLSLVLAVCSGLIYKMHQELPARQKWMKTLLAVSSGALCVLCCASFGLESLSAREEPADETVKSEETSTQITVPFAAGEIAGQSYTQLASRLREAGFTNVSSKSIEDLTYSQADQAGTAFSVSIDGNTDFTGSSAYDPDVPVIISYHAMMKGDVNVHINFVSNLLFSQYPVDFYIDDILVETLPHGQDCDLSLTMEPGEHTFTFQNDEIKASAYVLVRIEGDANLSIKVTCTSRQILAENEYVENLSAVRAGQVMLPQNLDAYSYQDACDVKEELEQAGFTNVSLQPSGDLLMGYLSEGKVESVLIDGYRNGTRGDIFSEDVPVVITYYEKEDLFSSPDSRDHRDHAGTTRI